MIKGCNFFWVKNWQTLAALWAGALSCNKKKISRAERSWTNPLNALLFYIYIYINRPTTFGSHCVRNSIEHRCSENLHNVAALPQIRISRNVGRADVPNKIIALYGCSNQSGSPLQPPPGFQLGSGRDGTALL